MREDRGVSILARFRAGRWLVWGIYRAFDKPLPVEHAAEWMMIPTHSVDQVLETNALESLHPTHVLEAARRMDAQRREHDERHAEKSGGMGDGRNSAR